MLRSMSISLSAAALLAVALPVQAAPAPADEPAKIDKYLPDETGGVFVFNLKPIRESKAYTKGLEKTVNELLKKDEVQSILKDAGLDPLKDIDRVILANVPGREGMGAPYFVVEGRFDPDKLAATAEALGKKYGNVKAIEIGKVKAFEMTIGPVGGNVAAILDKHTVIFAETKEDIEQAVEKAAGKKKTALKSKGLAKLIDKMDGKEAFTAACAAEMGVGGSVSNVGGVVTRKVNTLADEGIESVVATVTVTDVIKGKVVFTAKDAETAKAVNAKFEAGLAQATAELTREAARQKELEPVLEVLKGIKQSSKDQTITFEGQGTAETLEAFVKAIFMSRAVSVPAPPPLPPAGK
jgi:hypothetical protein